MSTTQGAPSLHYRACNLCEAICGIVVEQQDGQVLSIRADQDDPFSRGHICPKALALADLQHDPDRVRRPMRRSGSDWQEIGWDQAFTEIGERLRAVRRQHGRDAVAFYGGNPSGHNYGSTLWGMLFFPNLLRSKNRFSSGSIDQLPRLLVSTYVYGHQAVIPIPDLDRTSYMLILGANPIASNGSIMTAPGVADRLKELRRRGGKLVVLDPRRTETAAVADEHHFIRPGRDAFFLLGLLHTLFAEGLTKPGALTQHIEGLAEVQAIAARFSPEAMGPACGIPAEAIRRLARELAAAPAAICYGRMGTCVQEFGALSTWLIDVVNVVTGNLDRPGGLMFPTPAVDLVRVASLFGERGHFGRWRSRVRGLPEFSGELPVVTLAEEIDTPGQGQIRALLTSAGNPVLSSPNGRRLDRALEQLELMVSVDIYQNETTRHAHYILPPTSALEHENYDLVFHLVGVRNTFRASPASLVPPPGALHDWQIFVELGAQLLREGPLARLKSGLLRALGHTLTPERFVDLALRLGPYGDRFNPFSRGLNLRKVKAQPHGIDLGPLQPRLPELLFTPGRKIRLAPPELTKDLARLERRLQSDERPELVLIGRRELRTNNSWMHNSERLVRGRRRCTLLMHPEDAAARGLTDGQRVQIRSRVGTIEAALEVTADILPGVVSLPHGWGHDRPGMRLSVASAHPGVSINDITDELRYDELSGNADVSGVPVTVASAPDPRQADPAEPVEVSTV